MAQTFNNGEQLGSIRTVLNDNADEINALQASKASANNPAFTGNFTVTTDSSSAAVTITQTGAGNALVVEDSTSPDSTPFVITADGSVGIGTSSPSFSAGSGLQIYRASGAAVKVEDANTNADLLAFGGTLYLSNRSNGPLTFSTNATERMRIDASGNVGIGTASPSQKLSVSGYSDLDGLRIGGADTSNTIYQATGTLSLSTGSATGIVFKTNLTDRMAIDASGNVGIGTSSYGDKLTIAAGSTDRVGFNVSGVVSTMLLGNQNSGAGSSSVSYDRGTGLLQFSTGTTGSLTAKVNVDASGNVGIGTTTPNDLLQIVAANPSLIITRTSDFYYSKFSADGIAAFTNANGDAPVIFKTATTERMRIDASGNVGIGTTSPSEKLDVIGQIQARPIVNGTGLNDWFSIGSIQEVSNYGVALGLFVEDQGTNKYAMTFGTKSGGGNPITERMRIDASGNVGIGATSVASKLHVEGGSVTCNIIASSGNGTFRLANSATASNRKEFFIVLDTTNNRVDMQAIQQGVAYNSITLNAGGGNVGIGTTSPSASSVLDAQSTTQGVRFPNMTTTQKNAISNVAGNVVFDTTLGKLCVNTGSGWQTITSI